MFHIYFIFKILSSSYINATVFISVVWKFSIGVRTQQLEDLKGVYGLKFFYQPKDEKLFSTLWCASGKDLIVCGHEDSDVDSDQCAFCFGKYSHDGNQEWMQYPDLGSMNSVFTISFSLKVKICTIKIFRISYLKMIFSPDGNTFL